MEKMLWSKKYSVGVKEFDDQHKIIFDLINDLIERKNLTVQSEKLTAALGKMTEYFWVHLRREEKFMRDYGYPEYDEHVNLHTKFKKKIMEFNLDQMGHIDSVPDDLLIFLNKWWSTHILTVDMRYRSFCNDNEIK